MSYISSHYPLYNIISRPSRHLLFLVYVVYLTPPELSHISPPPPPSLSSKENRGRFFLDSEREWMGLIVKIVERSTSFISIIASLLCFFYGLFVKGGGEVGFNTVIMC